MFCRKCGSEIPDNVSFCPVCGAPVVTDKSEKQEEKPILEEEQVVSESSDAEKTTGSKGTSTYESINNSKKDKTVILICLGLILAIVIFVVVLCTASYNDLDSQVIETTTDSLLDENNDSDSYFDNGAFYGNFNPFNYVKLSKMGPDGYATLDCKVLDDISSTVENHPELTLQREDDHNIVLCKDGYIIARLNYYIDMEVSNGYVSNGDSYTFYCDTQEADILKNEYNIDIYGETGAYKTGVVSGLGDYIKIDYNLTEEQLNQYINNSKQYIQEEDSGAYEIQLNDAYIGDLKDQTKKNYDNVKANFICLRFYYTIDVSYGSGQQSKCAEVVFSDICANEDNIYSNYYTVNIRGYSNNEPLPQIISDYYPENEYNIRQIY